MLPMTELYECRDLIYTNPIQISVLLGKRRQLLLSWGFRCDVGVALHTFRHLRHVNQFPGVCVRMTCSTTLLQRAGMELVVERNGLFGGVLFCAYCSRVGKAATNKRKDNECSRDIHRLP